MREVLGVMGAHSILVSMGKRIRQETLMATGTMSVGPMFTSICTSAEWKIMTTAVNVERVPVEVGAEIAEDHGRGPVGFLGRCRPWFRSSSRSRTFSLVYLSCWSCLNQT